MFANMLWPYRLDHHLQHHIVHKSIKYDERLRIVNAARETHWSKGFHESNSTTDTTTVASVRNVNESDDENSFVARSKPLPLTQGEPQNDYIPPRSLRLTIAKKREWNIKDEDYFSIYFESAEDVLDNFQEELIQSGHERDNAVQHRNQVSLIWAALNKDLTIFPINPLSNIHLFRDFYHRPTFKRIGTKTGVQASTLRARFGSLASFIQYLRRNEVFAGMSRMQLSSLAQSIKDFNKQLNPYIKQRKVELRKTKAKQLLRPAHFISYGESSYVQGIIRQVKNGANKRSKFTRSFAIQYRDYLIASLVIGNGLRASNIMELTMKDFDNCITVKGYEGHKVLSNNKYKTSTIYGEKFIVISCMVYEQYLFYQKHLRLLVSKNPSSKAFLPASGAPKLNQTNVSASLTASFKLAKVLRENEYQRVSCTRIRCGLATFACNDGGFESAFFAKHFMKNREQTTDMHYNLLSNRRHALSIAMKLYESFSCVGGKEITADSRDISNLVHSLNEAAKHVDKENVIKWLKNNDPNIKRSELADFEEILSECTIQQEGKSSKFYGTTTEVSLIFCFTTEYVL